MRLVNLTTLKMGEFAKLPNVGSRCTSGREGLCVHVYLWEICIYAYPHESERALDGGPIQRAASGDITVVSLGWAVTYRGLLGAENLLGNVTESNAGLNHNVIFLGN